MPTPWKCRVLATRPSRIEFVVGTQIKDKISQLIDGYYQAFFTSLSQATDTDYEVETYTDQQASPGFRAEFLRTLERLEDIRWWMAPSHGVIHIRVPCPACGWAEKRADRTKLARLDEDGATFTAVCFDHGGYETHIDPEDNHAYLDLATLGVRALSWTVPIMSHSRPVYQIRSRNPLNLSCRVSAVSSRGCSIALYSQIQRFSPRQRRTIRAGR